MEFFIVVVIMLMFCFFQFQWYCVGVGFQVEGWCELLDLFDFFIMVDYFCMSEVVFVFYLYVGFLVVIYFFDDLVIGLVSCDFLGGEYKIMFGDLYWMVVGCGVMYDEFFVEVYCEVYGLQIFVNLFVVQKLSVFVVMYLIVEQMLCCIGEGWWVVQVFGGVVELVLFWWVVLVIVDIEVGVGFDVIQLFGEQGFVVVIYGSGWVGELLLFVGCVFSLVEGSVIWMQVDEVFCLVVFGG